MKKVHKFKEQIIKRLINPNLRFENQDKFRQKYVTGNKNNNVDM